MKSHRGTARGWWLAVLGSVITTFSSTAAESTQPLVSVVRAMPLALTQADAAREGAAEFVVLMEIARIQSQPRRGGLVGVGNRSGLFSFETEEALRGAVLQGIPVVKLAPRGQVTPAPHGLFLDGGNLTEDEACRVLTQCLATYGTLPQVRNSTPSRHELAAIQQHLKTFQQQLSLAASARLASR